NYYGKYYKSALYPTLRHIDSILARWAHRKFKSLRRHQRRLRGDSLGCLLTGAFFKGAAEHWEPYEGRPSRTVLRAPGGEIPPGDSPTGALPDRARGRGPEGGA